MNKEQINTIENENFYKNCYCNSFKNHNKMYISDEWINIFTFCDIKSLLNISEVNKGLYLLSSTVWKIKLNDLFYKDHYKIQRIKRRFIVEQEMLICSNICNGHFYKRQVRESCALIQKVLGKCWRRTDIEELQLYYKDIMSGNVALRPDQPYSYINTFVLKDYIPCDKFGVLNCYINVTHLSIHEVYETDLTDLSLIFPNLIALVIEEIEDITCLRESLIIPITKLKHIKELYLYLGDINDISPDYGWNYLKTMELEVFHIKTIRSADPNILYLIEDLINLRELVFCSKFVLEHEHIINLDLSHHYNLQEIHLVGVNLGLKNKRDLYGREPVCIKWPQHPIKIYLADSEYGKITIEQSYITHCIENEVYLQTVKNIDKFFPKYSQNVVELKLLYGNTEFKEYPINKENLKFLEYWETL